MYFNSSMACNLPNSGTPMSAAAISAQDAYVASVGADFDNGDNTLGALILALGGNSVDSSTGDAGLPTVGVPYFNPAALPPGAPGTSVPAPGAPGTAGHGRAFWNYKQSARGRGPGSGPGVPALGAPGSPRHGLAFRIYQRNAHLFGGGVMGGGIPLGVPGALLAARRAANATGGPNCSALPQVMPLQTVFPTPALSPVTVVPASSPVPAAAPAPAAPRTPLPIPSTGNVCADLTLGLITKDQVTLDQMRYCSDNGYQGANVPPSWITLQQIQMATAGTLPQIPFQASPPNTDMRGYPSQYLPFFQSLFNETGFSGMGDAAATSSMIPGVPDSVTYIGAGALLLLLFVGRKKGRG